MEPLSRRRYTATFENTLPDPGQADFKWGWALRLRRDAADPGAVPDPGVERTVLGRPEKAEPIVATCQSRGQVATPLPAAPRPPPISPSRRRRRSRAAAGICALPHHRDSQVHRAIRFAGI